MADLKSPRLVGIVLAAGESRRMGVPKLLLPVGDGSLLINAVWFLAELMPVVVVTGAYPDATREHLNETKDRMARLGLPPLRFAHNPDWRGGMAGSIATGIRSVQPPDSEAFFITVADQPGLAVELLPDYLDPFELNPTRIIATWYPEGPGVPAIFPARFRELLLANDGQGGAKRIIRNFPEDVVVVREELPPFVDVDTPEDYERLTGRKPRE